MYIGVDVISGLTHTAVGTAANVSDVAMAGQLLRSGDKVVFSDAGYTGATKRPEGEVKGLTQYAERLKASVRARVGHPFHIVKNRFGQRIHDPQKGNGRGTGISPASVRAKINAGPETRTCSTYRA